jgi:hypothetical protein
MKIRLSKSKITTKFSQALKLVGTKEIVELNILTKLCHGTRSLVLKNIQWWNSLNVDFFVAYVCKGLELPFTAKRKFVGIELE